MTGTAGAAATIAANSATSQTAPAGTAVSSPPSVLVKDANGNPVAGVAVTFAVAPGNGTITGGSQTTNASGVATVGSWTLSPTAGQNTLTASSGTLSGSPVTFTATGTAGAAAAIAANSPTSQSTPAGTAVSSPPSVLVKDANGNPVAGVAVTFAAAAGRGGNTGRSRTAQANGAATFSALTWTGAAGSYTLSFGTPDLASVTAPITLNAGPPATITNNSPTTQSGTVGTAVASPPSVLVQDAAGNPVTGVAVTFGVAPGNGSVTGGSQTTNGSGIATVGSWTLSQTVGTNTLTAGASGSGITGNPVTFTADGTAGTATQMAFTVPPSNTPAGAAISPPVQVTARDQFGNTATQFTGNITLAIPANSNPGGGTLSGTKTVAAVSGVATFSDLSINNAGNGYRLRATSSGLTAVSSPQFNITTVTPTQLVFTVPPSNTTAGGASTPPAKATPQV